jgi:molecular chaperone Hsp33
MSGEPEAGGEGIEVRTYFVRGRNALVARAEFGSLYVDMYLHLAQHRLRHPETADTALKEALAAVVLHAASRPRAESVAWTLHSEDPLQNVFVAASNRDGTVVGNAFTEDVRSGGRNVFIAETVDDRHPKRRSTVDSPDASPFRMMEEYYRLSEQRPARLFEHGDEDYVFVGAQPQCDLAWFAQLDDDAIRTLDRDETLSLLERRVYRWGCGCGQERVLAMITPLLASGEDLFGDSELITVTCPRCGARHRLTRETVEAHQARSRTTQ